MPVMSAAYMRQYRALRAIREADGGLLPFQRRFVEAVCRQTKPPDIAVLSVPRGNGKSWLCGQLVARALTPGDPLFEPAVENVLVSASRSQAAIVLDFTRAALGESDGYRWRADGVVHKETRTRVRVISSDANRALGLGANVRLIVADEPGAWGPTAGRRLWDAITTALGKRRTNGRGGRHAGPGTVDRPGVVVAVVCDGGEFRRAARLAVAGRPREVARLRRGFARQSGRPRQPVFASHTGARTRGGAVERAGGETVQTVQTQYPRRAR